MCLAVPVKIIEVFENGMARVEKDGVKFDVATVLTPNVEVGSDVLVHAGFIIEKISVEDAAEKNALLKEFYEKTGRK